MTVDRLPARELRKRIDIVTRECLALAAELPRVLWRSPRDAREALKWVQALEERAYDLGLALESLNGHLALLKDLAAEEWDREREELAGKVDG